MSRTGDIAALDLPSDLGEGLWGGVNATLAGVVERGVPRISSVTTYRVAALPDGPGARVWLGDDGFSIAAHYWQGTTQSFSCPEQYDGTNDVRWYC